MRECLEELADTSVARRASSAYGSVDRQTLIFYSVSSFPANLCLVKRVVVQHVFCGKVRG